MKFAGGRTADAGRLYRAGAGRRKKRLKAGDDPALGLLFYLFRVKNWGLSDLKALYESRDGWQEIIRAFLAYEIQLWQEK